VFSSVHENTGFRGMKFLCPIGKAFFEKKGLGGGGMMRSLKNLGCPYSRNFLLNP